MSGMVEGGSQSSSECSCQVDLNMYMAIMIWILCVLFIVFENSRSSTFWNGRGIGAAESTRL